MEKKVIIGHAKGEDAKAEQLAKALRLQGCEVIHRGTLLVGDSYEGEFDVCLSKGFPVVFCGTTRAVGSTWATGILRKAKSLGIQIFPVRMDKDANLELHFHNEKVVADCTGTRFDEGVNELNESLEKYFTIEDPYSSIGPVDVSSPATYLDELTYETAFDEDEVTAYRERLRPEIRIKHPVSRPHERFLSDMGFLVDNKLTLLGLLLFRTIPSKYYLRPLVKCSLYDGTDKSKTAVEKADYDEPVQKQFDKTLDFILTKTGERETYTPKHADLEMISRYPIECLREMLANALCHREYSTSGRDVQVRIFEDRIQIASPGIWCGEELLEGREYVLTELQTEAHQRNPRLAKAMYAIRLFEGRAEGISKSIRDCKDSVARIPTVIQKDKTVYVTIYPREDWDQVGGPEVGAFKDVVAVRSKTPQRKTGTGRKKTKTRASVAKLRAVVNKNKTCAKLFGEAEVLARRIFEGEKYVPLPFYTEHGVGNCEAVERLLDQIIWKNKKAEIDGRYDFVPSPEEAMYLLSAVWLHDIGMWYGILGNEQPEHLKDAAKVIKLREIHEFRTSRYIQDKWTEQDCSWRPEEKDWLSNICVYHRGRYDMNGFQPVKESGRRIPDRKIRLGVLAALLRLADACHVDKRRAPQRVMDLYISLGMPAEARLHWERADLIKDVRFEHDDRRIVLKGHYPRKFDFGLGVFDVREVGEMICENVRGELRSVQQTLSPFSNIDFRDVRHIPHQLRATDYKQKQKCLQLWPYFLSRPLSATEAAAALAQMLLLSVEQAKESGDFGEAWREDMYQMMEKTKSLREQDFMIRNLCIAVNNLLSELPEKTKSATKLTRYLRRFTKSIGQNCSRLVAQAQKVIRSKDVLVLYGHSVTIERLLRDIDKNHCLYIVDCYRPLDGRQILDENKKILQVVKNLRFNRYKFLQFASLAGALDELNRKKMPCKVLLGTHGRLKGGDLLCKVGSNIITATAKRFGAQVIAFCETTKFLIDSIKDVEIAGSEKIFSSEDEKMHPQFVNVPYVAPKIDRVPKRFVDMVITEKGVERRRKPTKRGVGTGRSRSKGRKANKAKGN